MHSRPNRAWQNKSKGGIDKKYVHKNTLLVNTLSPLWNKLLKVLETRLPDRFRQPPVRRRHFEIQLEFPWRPKR